MSNLSWLNPTPHAIAVHASSPLSPVAPQHSLPSGRYSLLGPDFHRLDRTSLRLAHSFNHLVGAGEQRGRNFEAKCLRRLQVDGQFEFRGLLDRKIARVCARKDSGDVTRSAAIKVGGIGAIGHQAALLDIFAPF